jgi:hypothetical protein
MGRPSESAHIRTFPHNPSTTRLLIWVARRQFATSSRGTARLKGSKGGLAALPLEMGQISMLTARVSFGLGGLLLVNVVLLAAQMVLGISYLPI